MKAHVCNELFSYILTLFLCLVWNERAQKGWETPPEYMIFSQDVLTENAEAKDWTAFDINLWNALFGHYMAVEWKEVHAEDSETHTAIAITGDAM